MARLFLIFTFLPMLELYLLFRIGDRVGFLPTIASVIAVGFIGAALARREGFRVLREWQEALAEGRMPSEGALGGALVLAGGVLLVTPGVISDVAGLALLFPPTRRAIAAIVRSRLERSIASGSVRFYGFPGAVGGPHGPFAHGPRGPFEASATRSPPATRAASRSPASRPPAGIPSVIDVEGEVVEVDGGPRADAR